MKTVGSLLSDMIRFEKLLTEMWGMGLRGKERNNEMLEERRPN